MEFEADRFELEKCWSMQTVKFDIEQILKHISRLLEKNALNG